MSAAAIDDAPMTWHSLARRSPPPQRVLSECRCRAPHGAGLVGCAACRGGHPVQQHVPPQEQPPQQEGRGVVARRERLVLLLRARVHLRHAAEAPGLAGEGACCSLAARCAARLGLPRSSPLTRATSPQEPTPNTCVTVCGISSASGPACLQTLGVSCCASGCAAGRWAHAHRARAATDACTEACQRAVCLNTHQVCAPALCWTRCTLTVPRTTQVPAWNDQCLKRCTLECQRGRT